MEAADDKLELWHLPRDVRAFPCDCGGYSDKVDSTESECRKHGCGRDRPGFECCAVSFVCRICGKRYAGAREAPDMDWS